MKRNNFNKQAGFSMLELMAVIVIMAVLLGGVAQVFVGNDDKARVAKAKQDLSALSQAIDLYKMENRNYPSANDGLEVLVGSEGGAGDQYIKSLKPDPWGNDYQYIYPGTNGRYDLFSLGADGAEGGEGFEADIDIKDL